MSLQNYAFTRKERILKSEDFLKVKRKGKRSSTKNFSIHTFNNDKGYMRLGLAVSARTGSAVKRNRIKRLLREFFRLNKEKLPAGADILVTARSGCTPRDLKEVTDELSVLFIKKEK